MTSNSDVFVTFGADTGALEAAIAAIKSQMGALSKQMRSTANEFNMAAVSADSELGQKLKGLGGQLATAKDRLKELQDATNKGGDSIKQMADKVGNAAYEYGPWTGAHVQMAQAIGEGLSRALAGAGAAATALGVAVGGAALAVGASLAVVAAQTESLRSLDDAARAAKISMSALRDLNAAGAAVGIDTGQMNQEMSGFAQKLREAQVAGGDLADFLKENNVQIKDAQGNLLPVQQVFGKIAELILSSNNEMDRLATLSKLGFSSDMLRLVERQTDAVKTFANSTKSAQDEVLKQGLSDGEKLWSTVKGVFWDLADVSISASVSVLGAIGEIEHQGSAKFLELSAEAKAAFASIEGDAKAAAAAIQTAFEVQRREVMRQEGNAVRDGKSPFGALDMNAFGGKGAKAAAPSDKPSIKGLYDKGGGKSASDNGETTAELKGFDDQVTAAREAERAKESLYAEGVKLHLVSEAQKFAATKAALSEEYNAEKTALQQELALDSLKPSQKQAINDKLKALDLKYASDSEKLFLQSVEAQVRGWDQMVDTMSGSFSSGIMEMIRGTQTLRQTLQQVAAALTQQFIKLGVDMAANWAKAEIAQVVFSQSAEGQKTATAMAGASARGGIASSEAASGLAAVLGNALKSIAVSAGEAGAGAAGFMAPFIGPAAVGVGAAVKGAVTAMGMPSYDIGAYRLDHDQIAMVHKNEMIMPAAQAGAFRAMLTNAANGGGFGGGGGGDTHHYNGPVNINTTAQGIQALIKADPKGTAQAVAMLVRHGHLKFT